MRISELDNMIGETKRKRKRAIVSKVMAVAKLNALHQLGRDNKPEENNQNAHSKSMTSLGGKRITAKSVKAQFGTI